MPAKLPWFERRFSFDFPVEVYPDILERLRGTPARADDLIAPLNPAILTRSEPRADGALTWSIQENIGHLIDLEPLGHSRLDDYLAGAAVLTATDLANAATTAANHNARPIRHLLAELRRQRGSLIARLEALPDADFARTALHPRLKVPMRLVDWMYFVAAHDDYHLARITELTRILSPA